MTLRIAMTFVTAVLVASAACSSSSDDGRPTDSNGSADASTPATTLDGSPAVANDAAVDASAPPSPTVFRVTSPADGATVSGSVDIVGIAGSQWVNVAVYDAAGARVAPDTAPNGGSFSFSLDTTKLADGANVLSVTAFSVAPGQSGGTSASVSLTLMIDNAGGAQPHPAGSNVGVMWGVNGHPYGGTLASGPYSDIDQQMRLMGSLGIKHYRADFYGTDSAETALMTNLLAAAKPYGIVVTPVLIMNPDFFSTPQDAYNGGFAMGSGWSSTFKGKVTVYEIGNEENQKVLGPYTDNSNAQVWEAASSFAREREMLRGMLDGVHANGGLGAIGDAGGCNYGFEEALWQDGLRWDVTVIHPYDFWGYPNDLAKVWYNGASQGGCGGGNDMLQKHAQFGKPIWLTEFNWTPGVTANDKAAIGTGLTTMLDTFKTLAHQYDIEVADIYELFDEPAASGAEGQFGIFTSTGDTTAASDAVKTFIKANPAAIYAQ